MKSLMLLIPLVFAAACQSRSSVDMEPDPVRQRLASLPVELPEQTPFDHAPDLRGTYLYHYWLGYSDGRMGLHATQCPTEHPWYEAQAQGYYDGNEAGHEVWSQAIVEAVGTVEPATH